MKKTVLVLMRLMSIGIIRWVAFSRGYDNMYTCYHKLALHPSSPPSNFTSTTDEHTKLCKYAHYILDRSPKSLCRPLRVQGLADTTGR
jgi:hypothetical protein